MPLRNGWCWENTPVGVGVDSAWKPCVWRHHEENRLCRCGFLPADLLGPPPYALKFPRQRPAMGTSKEVPCPGPWRRNPPPRSMQGRPACFHFFATQKILPTRLKLTGNVHRVQVFPAPRRKSGIAASCLACCSAGRTRKLVSGEGGDDSVGEMVMDERQLQRRDYLSIAGRGTALLSAALLAGTAAPSHANEKGGRQEEASGKQGLRGRGAKGYR